MFPCFFASYLHLISSCLSFLCITCPFFYELLNPFISASPLLPPPPSPLWAGGCLAVKLSYTKKPKLYNFLFVKDSPRFVLRLRYLWICSVIFKHKSCDTFGAHFLPLTACGRNSGGMLSVADPSLWIFSKEIYELFRLPHILKFRRLLQWVFSSRVANSSPRIRSRCRRAGRSWRCGPPSPPPSSASRSSTASAGPSTGYNCRASFAVASQKDWKTHIWGGWVPSYSPLIRWGWPDPPPCPLSRSLCGYPTAGRGVLPSR